MTELKPLIMPVKQDPAARIMCQLEGRKLPEPTGYNLLIALYIRPDKVGSVYLPDRVRDEDKWQGRVGLVLAMGPDAYKSDGARQFVEPWCQPGDWVVFPSLEHINAKFEFLGARPEDTVVLACVADDRVICRVGDPTEVR